MNRQKRSCYISAPIGTNIENIRASLLERGVRILSPDNFENTSLHSNVLNLVSNADLVVGVITRKRRSQSVLFELGQAVALDRQIVVFAPPKDEYLPLELQQFVVLRISLLNRAAIDFAFDQVLSAPSAPKKVEKIRANKPTGMGARMSAFMDQADAAVATNEGHKFEELIAQAIRESGVEIIVEAPQKNRRVDLVVWSDVFQALFGHPLLIEIKIRLSSESDVRHALRECAQMAAEAGAIWSLLVYGDGPSSSKKSWVSVAPNVLSISAQDLLSKMRGQSFIDIIKDLRNRRVHGEIF